MYHFCYTDDERVIDWSIARSGRMVTVSWTRPSNAGVCCDQFRVITSNGSVVTSETQYTMEITRGERTNISVRCSDQGGTMGPQTNIPTVKQGALVKFASD